MNYYQLITTVLPKQGVQESLSSLEYFKGDSKNTFSFKVSDFFSPNLRFKVFFFFLNVTASGGLYFLFTSQFTVPYNYLCALDRTLRVLDT